MPVKEPLERTIRARDFQLLHTLLAIASLPLACRIPEGVPRRLLVGKRPEGPSAKA